MAAAFSEILLNESEGDRSLPPAPLTARRLLHSRKRLVPEVAFSGASLAQGEHGLHVIRPEWSRRIVAGRVVDLGDVDVHAEAVGSLVARRDDAFGFRFDEFRHGSELEPCGAVPHDLDGMRARHPDSLSTGGLA